MKNHKKRLLRCALLFLAVMGVGAWAAEEKKEALVAETTAPETPPAGPPALVNQESITSDGRSTISLSLKVPLPAEAGKLSILLRSPHSADVVELADIANASEAKYEIDLLLLPLVTGRYRLEVAVIDPAGKRDLLGVIPLNVESPADGTPLPGAFVFTPKVDVGLKAQVRERATGGARPSTRPTYHDGTIQASFETAQSGVDWELKSRASFAGSSLRSEATTFGTRGVNASKFDVQDYLVDLGYADTRAQLGQISASTHPVLYANVSNRGFSFAQRLGYGLEFIASAQSAGNLAGTSNFTGLSNRQSLFRNVGFGYDFITDNPGQLRADAIQFQGRQPVQLPDGRIDSERSVGTGLRLVARNKDADVRSELVLAQSDHFAPKPEGGIAHNTGHAGTVELGYDFLREWALAGQPLSLGLAARREYASPVFRSLGSSFMSNYQLNVEVLTAKWGELQAQAQGLQRLDNVDSDRRYVRNRISAQLFNVNIPASWLVKRWRSFFPLPTPEPVKETGDKEKDAAAAKAAKETTAAAAAISPWVPALSLSRNVYNQFADEAFIPDGYTREDLPHVVSTNHALGLDWKFKTVSFSWKSALVGEKNLQFGEDTKSSSKRRHGASVDWKVTKDISLALSSERALGERLDTPIDQINRQNRGKLVWKVSPKDDLSVELQHGKDYDTAGARSTTNKRFQSQWTRRFEMPGPAGKPLPGQAYLRLVDNDATNAARINDLIKLTTPRTTALQCGVTVSLF